MTGINKTTKTQKPSGEVLTSTMRVKAEPKSFRDPTSLHSISSVLHGISSYVAHSLPESLSRARKSSFKLDTPHHAVKDTLSETEIISLERKKTVSYASFSWITGHFSHDNADIGLQRKLCLLLGYADGFQIWDLSDIDNICEIVSFRDGAEVKSIEALPKPRLSVKSVVDSFQQCRALLAYTTDKKEVVNGEEQVVGSVLNFFSLRNHSLVKTVVYDNEEISNIKANERAILVLLKYTAVELLSPFSLEKVARFTDIFCHPITGSPVLALGQRLCAYGVSTSPPLTYQNSSSDTQTHSSNVERVAKEMMNGVKTIGEYGYRTLSSYLAISPPSQITSPRHSGSPKSPVSSSPSSGPFHSEYKHSKSLPEGMVVVRDILSIIDNAKPFHGKKQVLPIAHFQAHHHAVASLAFNFSGSLLVTASIRGTSFHVFEITRGSVKHLYKLSRGYTSAYVEDIVFSTDSKWLSVSTGRGTTHIYAINPYGGSPNALSHTKNRVENERTQPNRSSKDSAHISLSSIVRIKQRNAEIEAIENEISLNGSPSLSSYSPAYLSFQQQISTLPVTLFVTPPKSLFTTTRRGSDGLSTGHQGIFTFNKNGILTLHQLDSSTIALRKKKQGVIVNTFELNVSGEDIAEWNMFHGNDWPIVSNVVKDEENTEQTDKKQWITQSEIFTYHIYELPLWSSTQFTLQTYNHETFEMHYSQPFPQAKTIDFRRDMPIPYGVYIPKKAEDDEFSSDNELEGDLLNAIDSCLVSLPTISNKSNEIQIPNSVRNKTEDLSFDNLNFIRVDGMPNSNVSEKCVVQSADDDLEFLGYLNEESRDQEVPDEEIDEELINPFVDSMDSLVSKQVHLVSSSEERLKKGKGRSKKAKK